MFNDYTLFKLARARVNDLLIEKNRVSTSAASRRSPRAKAAPPKEPDCCIAIGAAR